MARGFPVVAPLDTLFFETSASQRLSSRVAANPDAHMTDPQTVRSETPPLAHTAIGRPAVEGKYVYCIIRLDKPKDFGSVGIGGGQRVYTVHYRDLAAIVSDTPLVIYDPTREHVLAHEFVNETVMREFTVIPM